MVPRELPAAVPHFTGRTDELNELGRLLTERRRSAGAVMTSVISGSAGVGKTALAVHWAHQVANQFPDGQLYVNLRGFDPSGVAVIPAQAIRGFLDAMGVSAAQIPVSPGAQAALYRSLLAGRQMLIVLDNARDAAAAYRHALRIYAGRGDLYNQSETLTRLGDTHRAVGNVAAARDAWRQAIVILDDLHHPEANNVRAKLRSLGDTSGAPARVRNEPAAGALRAAESGR